MKYVLTGATGFVGGAYLKHLLARDEEVTIISRRSGGTEWLRRAGASVIVADLESRESLRKVDFRGSIVVHCAGFASHFGRTPDSSRGNLVATQNLLAAVGQHRPRRFVFVSCAQVYGPAANGQTVSSASTTPTPARYNAVAINKLAAERVVIERCTADGIAPVTLRLGHLYGGGEVSDTLVSDAKVGELDVFGDGANRLPLLHVDDAVSAIDRAATHPRAVGHVFDVASDERVTQRQFVESLGACLGLKPTIRTIPVAKARSAATWAGMRAALFGARQRTSQSWVDWFTCDMQLDCTAIESDLGWSAEVPLAEGMRRTRVRIEALRSPPMYAAGSGRF